MRLAVVSTRPRKTAVAAVVAGVLTTGLLSGCSGGSSVPSIGYAIDNVVNSYNAGTSDGATSGAVQAFQRVLPGFSYIGPQGVPVADTDVGNANSVPGESLTIQYRLNPAGVYSDGVPTTCEDLVLAWAAHSGRFTKTDDNGASVPAFDTALTAGYSDIDRVQCQPGSKDATVVFRTGRGYTEWKSLFAATEMMPAHVVSRATGVGNLVSAITTGDQKAVAKIADFWNNNWKLTPGKLDAALLPSSGPYRIESFSENGGLVLVANDKWWGNKPATPRIVLWPKNSDVKDKVESGAVQVVDIGAGSIADLKLDGFTTANAPARTSEQLVLSTGGVLGSADARRALALCIPRKKLFDDLGHPNYNRTAGLGSGPLNSRLVQPDTLIYPAVAGSEGGKYTNGDVPGAVAALAAAGAQNPTVRIGYLAPDARRAKTVAEIAAACKPAGIVVQDAGAPGFTPKALREGKVDAVLAGTGSAPGAAGSATDVDARYALKAGSGSNAGNFDNPRYNAIVDQLAIDASDNAQLSLSVEAENVLWAEMPSIPLFNEPRTTAFANGLRDGVVNATKAGAGWNMDRWVLER